jgi:hypothetical protein
MRGRALGTPRRAWTAGRVRGLQRLAEDERVLGPARGILDSMRPEPDTEIRDVSVEEGEQLLDEQARRYLSMTGEEFARRWASGELEADTAADVMRVAMLLPLAGR